MGQKERSDLFQALAKAMGTGLISNKSLGSINKEDLQASSFLLEVKVFRDPHTDTLKVIGLREEETQGEEGEIIPICSNCKKTRNEQEQWKPIESFLLKKKVTCSHGICPDCVKELYPDFYDKD